MKRLFVMLCFWVSFVAEAEVLTAEQIIKLKEAGAGAGLISKIISSNAIYRALVTFDGVVKMKEAGIDDEMVIAVIDAGNPTVKVSAEEDRKDQKLTREIARREQRIQLYKKEMRAVRENLTALFADPNFKKWVDEGKLQGENLQQVFKYLKQFAAGEETDTFDNGDQINVDIQR